MEIEDLKSLWNELASNQTKTRNIDKARIKKLIKGKTQHAVSKINRSILLEVGSLMIATLFFAFSIFFQENIVSYSLLSVIIVFCSAYFLYYGIKYQRINSIINSGQNLRESLKNLIHTISYFLKFYLYSSLIVTPIAFILGFFYGYSSLQETSDPVALDFYTLLTLDIVAALLTVVAYPFMKWYIRRLYGRYLDELQDCLKELEVDSIS